MIGAGTLYFVAVYYEALTGREGMGGGDVNLFAMLGHFWAGKRSFSSCSRVRCSARA